MTCHMLKLARWLSEGECESISESFSKRLVSQPSSGIPAWPVSLASDWEAESSVLWHNGLAVACLRTL